MAYQSLYRRYRSRTFAEVRGQDHVTMSLRNAVRNRSVGHAYLFSGPRGTGKTSTARIFAKALNCTDLVDGEPCLRCESCQSIEAGTSYDLFELDAASNSGVEAMRELIGRTAVASPGRTKVYILDEVHMLTAGASNALLKTLEEPPDHVKFVLATTDPHKVLPTIRSRTQHFEFTLLGADLLTGLVRDVVADAGLDVDDATVAAVVREGKGSARDTLSALDRAVAAGGIGSGSEPVDAVLDAIAERTVGGAIAAVSDALRSGRDPRVLGEAALAALRNAFLLSLGVAVDELTESDRDELQRRASSIGTAHLTRSLEALGAALVEMRQAPDPRIPLEVALIGLCDPSVGVTLASLADRVERLERVGSAGPHTAGSPEAAAGSGEPPVRQPPAEPERSPDPAGVSAARQELGRSRPAAPKRADAPRPASVADQPPPPLPGADRGPRAGAKPSTAPARTPSTAERPAAGRPAAPTGPGESSPTAEQLQAGLPELVGRLKGVAKAIFGQGAFVSYDGVTALFALENAPTVARAERARSEVEAALAAQFGLPITLRLVERGSVAVPPAAAPVTTSSRAESDETIELDELVPADVAATGADRLAVHFPGAELIEENT